VPPSAGGKEPGVGAAGPDRQPDPFGAFRAIPLVSSFISAEIHSCIDVATAKVHPDKWAISDRIPPAGMIISRYVRSEIKMFADHKPNCRRRNELNGCQICCVGWTFQPVPFNPINLSVLRRTLTCTCVSARFEQAAEGPPIKTALIKAMYSRTLLLGLLLLTGRFGGS